ncbi:bifunctional 3-(3-hydroxy-phenyl)propionate/3-hydroxycinnamic acid hydroxylase [Nocardioides fonticola]|uniref:Bifunctional 3-(3-hydroxy-phenyl)propionate/3-hydroxycinnamic acid hydroxylase n=1 Tax=Nocardioides fonticola TaxID=450363 RepID=A0ABP7XLR0_9ACTN
MSEPQVVVVGAGPTGVTAAILLGQRGVRTLVLDRWPDVFPQPRAVHLDDEVYRLLATLGVAEEFAAVSRPGAGLRLMGPDHRTLAQFDRLVQRTSNGFPQATMFDQPELERLLRRRLAELPAVRLIGGAQVHKVVAGAQPIVRYRDEAGVEHELRPEVVLGCDGANSLVRSAIGASMRDLGFPARRWLVVDVATDRDLGQWEGVHQVCDSTRAGTYMRIGERRYRWEFRLHDDETAVDFADVSRLEPLIAPWVGSADGLEVLRCAEYEFRAQIADRWRNGRVLLLGDAAHLTPPFIGQGMGAGLRDAHNLAWKIADVLEGRLPEQVLDSYQQERAPHARAMIRLASMVGVAMTGGGRVGDLLRGVVVPVLPHLPGLRSRLLDSTTPRLSRSALVARRRGDRLAGSLCPNVTLLDGTRLDDAPGHRTLVRRGAPPPHGCPVVDVAGHRELVAWMGRAAWVRLRPDGVVAESGPPGAHGTLVALRPRAADAVLPAGG